MKKFGVKILIYLVIIVFGFACMNNEDAEPSILIARSIFQEDSEGWEAGFAEYEEGLEDSMRLTFSHGSFMASANIGSVSSVIQSGYATNSDLFMFIKSQISNLEPNTDYSMIFNLELYAQLNEKFIGDLTSSNSGSFLKAGSFKNEPGVTVIEDTDSNKRMVVTDFQKGEDENPGPNMVYLGKIIHTDVGDTPLLLIGTSEGSPILGTSDDEGKLWVVVGVDTNQPINQSIYYSYIGVQFRKN